MQKVCGEFSFGAELDRAVAKDVLIGTPFQCSRDSFAAFIHVEIIIPTPIKPYKLTALGSTKSSSVTPIVAAEERYCQVKMKARSAVRRFLLGPSCLNQ